MEYIFLVVSMLSSTSRSLLSKRLSPFTSTLAGFGAVNSLISGTAFVLALVYCAAYGSFALSGLTLALGLLYAVFTVLAQLSYMRALAGGRVSSVSFFYSCGFLIPTAAGLIVWREVISPVGAIGILLLLPAFWFCGSKDVKEKKATENKGSAWVIWALAAMASSGAVGLIQKIHRTSESAGEVGGFLAVSMGASFVLSLLPLIFSGKSPKSFGMRKSDAAASAGCGICVGASNIINLILTGLIPAVIFFPVFNGGVVVLSAAAARVFCGEKMTKKGLCGMIIGLCGIMLAALR